MRVIKLPGDTGLLLIFKRSSGLTSFGFDSFKKLEDRSMAAWLIVQTP